jgi:hypothetical protein
MSADPRDLLRALEQIARSQARLEQGFAKIGQESRKVAVEIKEGFGSRAIAGLEGMAVRWFSVAAAIGIAREALAANLRELTRIEEASERTTTSLTRMMAATGMLAEAERLKPFLLTLTPRGVGIQEGIGMLAALRGAAPQMPVEQLLRMTGVAAMGKMAGLEPAELAQTMGELSKVRGMAVKGGRPEAEQIGSIAAMVRQYEGRYGARFERGGWGRLQAWGELGLDPRLGLGFGMASLQAGQRAEGFSALVDILQEKKEVKPRLGVALSETEKAERDFYRLGAAERLTAIQGSEALRKQLFGTQAAGIGAMFAAKPTEIAAGITKAAGEPRLQQMAVMALKDREWAETAALEVAKAAAEATEYRRQAGEPLHALELRLATSRAKGQPAVERMIEEFGSKAVIAAGFRPATQAKELQEAADALQRAGDKLEQVADRLSRGFGGEAAVPGPADPNLVPPPSADPNVFRRRVLWHTRDMFGRDIQREYTPDAAMD